jgi:hypothetical protein
MQRAQGQIVETALITITETLPVALKAELELASDFARASKAKATQVAYCSDFRIFESWCRERGLSTLPATPATIAPSWRHKLALGSGLRLLGATSPRSNIQLRDRAILVVGFASAMRRSELVALKVEDLEWTAEGLPIQIRKGKTDQEGVGAAVAVPKGETGCPVAALKAWLRGYRHRRGTGLCSDLEQAQSARQYRTAESEQRGSRRQTRPGEVSRMRSEHIDSGWWEMAGQPAPELGWPGTKTGQTHRVWPPKPTQTGRVGERWRSFRVGRSARHACDLRRPRYR